MGGSAVTALAGLPAQPSAAREGLGEGDLFGSKARTLSDAGLEWLRSELTNLPVAVHTELGRLGEYGRIVGGDFRASMHTYEESPG